jgi:uncharacterized membrane protein YdjX (TVP38/TMEM64 family)
VSKIKRALYFQLAGLVLAVGVIVWLNRHWPVGEIVGQLQRQVAARGVGGAALYPLLYAACNVLLLPGGVLAMGSGLFFGLWWGFALNLLGNVLGAAGAFFISRQLGRGWIARRFLQHPKWAALDEAIARDGWKIILLSQLPPLSPVSLLNYLYGITRIRPGTALLWVAIGQTPSMFLYAYLGTTAQHGLSIWRGLAHPSTLQYAIWIGGLLLTLAVTVALGRIALRGLAAAERAATPAPPLPTPPRSPEPAIVEADVP